MFFSWPIDGFKKLLKHVACIFHCNSDICVVLSKYPCLDFYTIHSRKAERSGYKGWIWSEYDIFHLAV